MKRVDIFMKIDINVEKTNIDKTLILLKKNDYELNKYENSWNDFLISLSLYNADAKRINRQNK